MGCIVTKVFATLHNDVLEAVERCLFRSWLHPDSEGYLDPEDHKSINQNFQFLYKIRADSIDGFLTRGSGSKYHSLIVRSGPNVSERLSRISQIISKYLVASKPVVVARRETTGGDKKGKTQRNDSTKPETSVIYATAHFASPYTITQRILTDPDAIETGEIARFYSKLNMMRTFGMRVDLQRASNASSSNKEELDKIITFPDLDRLYKTLQRYVSGRDPYSKPSDKKSQFLLGYTASLGFLTLRLPLGQVAVKTAKVGDLAEDHKQYGELFLEDDFAKFSKDWRFGVEFTKNKQYDTLPSLAEISNRVFGIPIPLSGFTDLLKGGLKQGAGEGTVSLIRGGAGTGKTSLAISIQRSVEALGIPSVFVTSEETLSAVEARRESVLSISQKLHSQFASLPGKHKILRAPSGKLQEPAEANFAEPNLETNPLFAVLDGIIDGISEKEEWPGGATDFSKLFVVFDGIHNFLRDDESKDDYDVLKRFVEKCRETGVQVLLTSSKDWMLDEGFEYLVDNYFELQSKIIEEPVPYSERQFEIVKTRHQGSMIGKHRMAIGDEGDLQFQPNFSELLKKQARRSLSEPKNDEFSYPFRETDNDDYSSKKSAFNSLQNIKHYENCSTLLYGVGSASKTDLAFRILANPVVGREGKRKKILVVSFLASGKYYEGCADRHNRALEKRGFSNSFVETECLFFPPGMVSPEEVYFAISSKIDNSETTLNAFDGVLLDGVHNVFVQFPRLMGKPELWTSLTGMFRRCAIDFLVTYSDFDISPAAMLDSGAFSSERATPLMVSLTQTLDYGYNLVPRYLAERERQKRRGVQSSFMYTPGSFELSCFIAHRQQVSADEFLVWDKVAKTLTSSEEL